MDLHLDRIDLAAQVSNVLAVQVDLDPTSA
jgi:hypothetical protein